MKIPVPHPLYWKESPRLNIPSGGITFKALDLNLGLAIADNHTLLADQGPIRNQLPRGSCSSFAFLSAIEAYYHRHYGLTLNLSREYFIHRVFSTQLNGPLPHENFCTGPTNEASATAPYPGGWQMVFEDMALPEEIYAPYFGVENAALVKYGLAHAQEDLDTVAYQCGILTATGDSQTSASPITQKMVDDFEYDPRHIPLNARLHARYGATEMQSLSLEECHDTDLLERILFSNREVYLGLNLKHVDFGIQGANHYVNGDILQTHAPDGFPIGIWPVNVNNVDIGHAMLLIGYDRPKKLFLLKNSWGEDSWPYVWMSYEYIETICDEGLIITAVRDPNLQPCKESAWLGRWRLAVGGCPVKDLVIRRTRPTASSRGQRVPVGTVYQAGNGTQIIGHISDSQGNQLTLYPSLSASNLNADTSQSIVLNMLEFGRLATGSEKKTSSAFLPITTESTARLYRPFQSEDAAIALWVHGHLARPEYPDRLEQVQRRGWGIKFYAKPGQNNWFHLPLLTPAIRNGVRPKLARVYVLYRIEGGTGGDYPYLADLHVYDGCHKLRFFKGLTLTGDHSESIDSANTWEIAPALTIHSGLGLSIRVKFPAGVNSPSILFTTAGAEFVPKTMWI